MNPQDKEVQLRLIQLLSDAELSGYAKSIITEINITDKVVLAELKKQDKELWKKKK